MKVPPVSAASKGLGDRGSLSVVQGSKWPVSNSVLISVCRAAQGITLAGEAVRYSGWKLNGVPEQSAIDVVWKPLWAEACMKPNVCWVRSKMTTSRAAPPPGAGASNMLTFTWSPGFISSVSALGIAEASVEVWGAGGPAGTPLRCTKAKLTGSSQFGLHTAKPLVHSRLSIVSAAHQCVSSQLSLSTHGGLPGG